VGGLTCDIQDYYNAEAHINQVYLPKLRGKEPLYIGFFHIGAYQESLSGYGGIKHCMIPSPRHILVDKDKKGATKTRIFSEKQNAEGMLNILGY
jgi:arginine decarboxylase